MGGFRPERGLTEHAAKYEESTGLKHLKNKPQSAASRKHKTKPVPSSVRPEDIAAIRTDIQRSAHLATILLVVDNPEDAFMVGRAFQKVGVTNPLVVVREGEQAIQYLMGAGEYADRGQFPIPQLILLDLCMPGMAGFEVLAWLRQQPELRHLPVVILTTSTYSSDVRRAYQLGAKSFLIKPTDFIERISEVKAMSDFWLPRRGMDVSTSGVITSLTRS